MVTVQPQSGRDRLVLSSLSPLHLVLNYVVVPPTQAASSLLS